MKDGFISVACGTPKLRLTDCDYNAEQSFTLMRTAAKAGVKVLVLPELGLTGYTCGDLFNQSALLEGAREALATILTATRNLEVVTAVGLPLQKDNKLYNCAAIIQKGSILGVVPKTHIPNYGEFYEKRHFAPAPEEDSLLPELCGQRDVPFGTHLLFRCETVPDLTLGFEVCEDLWAPCSPSVGLCQAGATIIGNLSASDEQASKDSYRRQLVAAQSAKLICGYIYASAGEGESSSDLVFSGHAHGGQVRLGNQGILAPGEGLLPRYTSGLYQMENTRMVVSRGLGNSACPIRVFNPPHLPMVMLHSCGY